MPCHILVYKEGETSEIRGVKCDFKRISLGEFHKYEKEGYKKSVTELYTKPKRGRKPKVEE